jgi:two-component system response regulator PilR (NtrC family)
MQKRVLFISPSSEDTNALRTMLDQASIALEYASDFHQARSILEREAFGVVLTEARLPDARWEDVVNLVRDAGLRSQVVVTHPFADARFWADVLDFGAYDILVQPFCCSEVKRIISNALSSRSDQRAQAHTAL